MAGAVVQILIFAGLGLVYAYAWNSLMAIGVFAVGLLSSVLLNRWVTTRRSVIPVGHGQFDRISQRLMLIVAALSSVDSATFKIVREALQISSSVLSKQLWAWAEAGLIAVDKVPDGRVVVTLLRLTPDGRSTFTRHRRALESIAQGLDERPGDLTS